MICFLLNALSHADRSYPKILSAVPNQSANQSPGISLCFQFYPCASELRPEQQVMLHIAVEAQLKPGRALRQGPRNIVCRPSYDLFNAVNPGSSRVYGLLICPYSSRIFTFFRIRKKQITFCHLPGSITLSLIKFKAFPNLSADYLHLNYNNQPLNASKPY